jgi:tyrosine decarboxylase/aspartate 1-decarboxylase
MTYFDQDRALLCEALDTLADGFSPLPETATATVSARGRQALLDAAERMQDNYPYHHPLYIGQMLKPPHPLARQAYALAQFLNPNNHALDGGRASSQMEKEVVADVAAMLGWSAHLGHLCGGGTMANFEALWVGREQWRSSHGGADGAVVASSQAHYTHERLSAVLGVPFTAVGTDARGRMSMDALRATLDSEPVATVVATLGTTAIGAVDPLAEILALQEVYRFRLHVDAAYGGYFGLVDDLDPAVRQAIDAVIGADSFVVDPHKHGLQPYGCGCVLFRDPSVGRFYRHDSPYTYFTGDDLHLGEISLECSRAGAAAVALWTTMRALPLERGGEFADMLANCLQAARRLAAHCEQHPQLVLLQAPALDIVAFAVRGDSASQCSARARHVFEAAARHDLHLALVTLPRALCTHADPTAVWDENSLVCLRACAMKPEHLEWMPEIIARLDRALGDVLADSA